MLSAIVDNIPVVFAVLSMNPVMDLQQWLLVTMTAGVGGSLLSIGSAAGVALMGQTKGVYSFMGHLKWSWVIVLGYAASIFKFKYRAIKNLKSSTVSNLGCFSMPALTLSLS